MLPEEEQTPSTTAPPFFSVIIPAYNRSDSISAAIDSVMAQTCNDHEIIVIDDGSTDATPEKLSAYGSRIRVYRQSNAGGGPARQFGISHARGEYVAFLDSDDLWPPWTLETYRHVIAETGCPSLLLGTASHTDQDPLQIALKDVPVRYAVHSDFLASAREYNWFGFSIIAARRSRIPATGGLPASRVAAQDLFFLLMLGAHPGFVVIESPPTAIYRRHAGNISGNPVALASAMRNLIDYEQRGVFPGGTERRTSRRTLLCRSARAASVTLLRAGMQRDALAIYAATWQWQAADARWKYLVGFPIACAAGAIMNGLTASRGFTDRIPKHPRRGKEC